MYIYVLLFILVIILIFIALFSSNKESFSSNVIRIDTEPDWSSLETYCRATDRSFKKYKDAIVTKKYPKQVQWIESVIATTKCEWSKEISRWSVAITDGSIEYGYAFTMGHTMYLPISYLQNTSDSDKKELFYHELRHIWQRQDYSKFIKTTLDPVVWRDWKFVVLEDPIEAVKKLKRECQNDSIVINPDTFQVISYYKNSNHPMYPLKQSWGLEYIMKDHSKKITWNDPHPCEWDAREAAQKILLKE